MTNPWKYKSVSLCSNTYSDVEKLQSELIPGLKLSKAKAIEFLIKDKVGSAKVDITEGTANETEKTQKTKKTI